MSKAELGAGDVPITLDGQEVVLRPSLEACQALCRSPGGLYQAGGGQPSVVDRLLACDIDTMAMIVRLGLGLGASAVKDLDAQIYRTGLLTLRQPLCDFVGIVANGGQRPTPTEGEGDPPGQAGA